MMAEAMIRKSDYDLCEQENSNLRRHLAWAGKFLSTEQIWELQTMIELPIEDGGVVKDGTESDYEYTQEIKRLCVKAAELLREAIPETIESPERYMSDMDNANWWGRAEGVANKLMEFDPPSPEACLAAIRNCKRV